MTAPLQSWVFNQFMPPGARGAFAQKLLTDPLWFAEEKVDGDRRIAQFCSDNVRFTGRIISKITNVLVERTANLPHLNPPRADMEGTVLDGEIVCPWKGARSRDVTSIMGSQPAEAIRKQKERGWVRFVVFDCLFYKGEDMRQQPLAIRRQRAAQAVAEWNNPNVGMVRAAIDNRAAFLAEIWAADGEGIILKRINSKYGDEKAWVKVKREETYDVVIMGFDPPKDISAKVGGSISPTKYAAEGLIGAIRFGQYKDGVLTYCGSCSGFDDKVRRSFSKMPDSFLGMVMEITAQLRETESGKFRHPRFKQFRDNKMAEQCIWGQK